MDSARRTSRDIIREVIRRKELDLERIKFDIVQLTIKEKTIQRDLIRAKNALSPPSLLPDEILSRIFIVLAQDYGVVYFAPEFFVPMDRPPQLTVSHVCSDWRKIALCTSELWSNTDVVYDETKSWSFFRRHQRWVSRAGRFPVTISLNFYEPLSGDRCVAALQRILLPFQVKKLTLSLSYEQFLALSALHETALSTLSELELELRFPTGLPPVDVIITNPHHFVTRLRSVTFYDGVLDPWLDKFSPDLAWSQLRSLQFSISMQSQQPLLKILRQIPTLQMLNLRITGPLTKTLENFTMPSLREFSLRFSPEFDRIELNKLLQSFTLPSLVDLALIMASDQWTGETFEILKQHYNIRNLEEIYFIGGFTLPISFLLQEAPSLCSLSIHSSDPIFDDAAILGISSGTLGRFLRQLDIEHTAYDVGEILDMVAVRKNRVDELIENGCTWKEEITAIRDVTLWGRHDEHESYEERINALKEAGIIISIPAE